MGTNQYNPFGDTGQNTNSVPNKTQQNNNNTINSNYGQIPNGQIPYQNMQGNVPNNYAPYNSYVPQYNNGARQPWNMQEYYQKEQILSSQKKEIRRFGNMLGLAIVAYLAIQVVLVFLLNAANISDLYFSSSLVQSAVNMVAISFFGVAVPFGVVALINKKYYTVPLIPAKKVSAFDYTIWISFGMLCCIGANLVVSMGVIPLFKLFGYELVQSEQLAPDSVFACVMTVLAVSVMPAICEEFAMRCCAQQLLVKYGKSFAVLAISIVFGLLHGNVIQFVFAFIVGLALAYVTVKTDSIVPAILIHAFNNGMSAISSVVTYAAGEKAGEYATSGIFIFWIVAGLAALAYLLVKDGFKTEPKVSEDNTPTLTMGQKLAAFFLVPGMIPPFVLLVLLTFTTIQKI